jgi:integrase
MWKPAVVALCLWLTGWRRSEINGKVILGKFRPGVLWSEKDGDSLLLPGERNKGRKAKRIPLTGELKALIDKRENLKVAGCHYIFHRNGRPIGEFDAKWKKA